MSTERSSANSDYKPRNVQTNIDAISAVPRHLRSQRPISQTSSRSSICESVASDVSGFGYSREERAPKAPGTPLPADHPLALAQVMRKLEKVKEEQEAAQRRSRGRDRRFPVNASSSRHGIDHGSSTSSTTAVERWRQLSSSSAPRSTEYRQQPAASHSGSVRGYSANDNHTRTSGHSSLSPQHVSRR